MMACRALGRAMIGKLLPEVLLITWSAVISSSSPSIGLDGRADHHLQAEVDGVLQEDARKVAGDHHEVGPLQARGGLLARGAAAEILAGHDDALRRELLVLDLGVEFGIVDEGELRGLGRQDGGHEAARIDDIGGDVVSDFKNDFGHVTFLLFSGSVMTPVMALAAATAGEQR